MNDYPNTFEAWADLYSHWQKVHGKYPVLARFLIASLKEYQGTLPAAISCKLYNREDERHWPMRLGSCLEPMIGLRVNDSGLRIERATPAQSTGPNLWVIKINSFDDPNKTEGG